jgi:ABC-type lipoprotein release transport system permease subunit
LRDWPPRSRVRGFCRDFSYQIAPTDAATYAGAAVLVFLVTAAACYLPARRTLGVPPMAVLKSD